ncbi:bacterial transcriptional activator domain-containing protein [Xanthomonas campestris]|uniref:Bacterial transcriptional activator domain-containing protein n=1 Tax=Xanthomonas campestris pv. papavericola TaxID=487881 RepID=A0AAJ2X4P9_XANCA|nr:bacterial transcriptional activator domain-containing protein [Xanthomonas campestris]MEC3888831.1 bacterial transcriptional activator domain-containing protein [Xanthomonas campestris pv. papavericola]
MEIWNWVEKLQDDLGEAGQPQNAQLLTRLTDHICDLQIERAEALLPEARALGKTLANPWLEVFVGHWEMRNRVGNLCEGERALGDAVSLFERAHRPDAVECPQSVCVTQDLAACYANIDGPGWVEERIEVCEETLARIDPSWSCYQCLSCEKADALLDDGRGDAALAYLEQQSGTILAHGGEIYDGVPDMRISILLALGRAAEALELVEQREREAAREGAEWANCSQPRQLQKTRALALLGRDEEAMQALLPWRDVAPRYRLHWLRAVAVLVSRAPERNSWDLGSRVQTMLDHYAQVGAHRILIEAAELAIGMALQRGAVWTARRHLALARAHVPKLRLDRGATELLNTLAARIDAAPVSAPPPAPADQLLAWLSAQDQESARNPEQEAQWLLQAVAERPDDAELVDTAASALSACAADEDAIASLWQFVQRHADRETSPTFRLMNLLLGRGDEAGVRRLAQLYRAQVPVAALWCEAQLAQRLADWPALEQACTALLALSPSSHGARGLLARMYLNTGRFAEAADVYRQLIELLEEPRSAYWDHMTAASAAQDWDAVRASAQAIGMELSSTSGVVEETWGWVIIRCIEDGEVAEYYARRTGPVTARIVENAPSQRRQHVGDWVVFDAELVYPPPEDEAERERFVPTYPQVHVLQAGGYGNSWLVDGVHPGEPAIDALRKDIEARGWTLWVHSRDDYRLIDPDNADAFDAEDPQSGLPGVLFTVALPEAVPPLELHRALVMATAGWPHRMCWMRLAEACDQDTTPHMQAIERYGL